MATKSKQTEPSDDGVPVRTTDESRAGRYEDGVPVLVPDVPDQTAGANKAGQSADNTKEK